jgi:hypothetical protein
MPEWTENDMRLALELHASGASQNKAADTYGISRNVPSTTPLSPPPLFRQAK